MTLYRVYYRENGRGCQYVCYVEVADSLGSQKARAARQKACEDYGIEMDWITKTIKDC